MIQSVCALCLPLGNGIYSLMKRIVQRIFWCYFDGLEQRVVRAFAAKWHVMKRDEQLSKCETLTNVQWMFLFKERHTLYNSINNNKTLWPFERTAPLVALRSAASCPKPFSFSKYFVVNFTNCPANDRTITFPCIAAPIIVCYNFYFTSSFSQLQTTICARPNNRTTQRNFRRAQRREL